MKSGHAAATRGTWVWCSITSETRIAQRSRVVRHGEVVAAVAAYQRGEWAGALLRACAHARLSRRC